MHPKPTGEKVHRTVGTNIQKRYGNQNRLSPMKDTKTIQLYQRRLEDEGNNTTPSITWRIIYTETNSCSLCLQE